MSTDPADAADWQLEKQQSIVLLDAATEQLGHCAYSLADWITNQEPKMIRNGNTTGSVLAGKVESFAAAQCAYWAAFEVWSAYSGIGGVAAPEWFSDVD